ncbi:MAG: extracellular solute-binding protein [Clostridia bacterium]|nr:extracellular solute-binding protein [Clostridia bacterium]
MRKLLIAVVAAVLMCSCTACGGGTSKNTYEDGKLVLKVWAPDEYAGAQVKAKFQKWIDDLNARPEMETIGVKLKFQAVQQMPTTLNTSAMAGNQPDLIVWDRFATPSNTQVLYPLNDLIARDGIDSSAFMAEAYNELTVYDKEGNAVQYGLPMNLDPWGIYINTDIVNEYNQGKEASEQIDVNDLGTWTKVLDAAKKLTVRKGSEITRSGLNTTSADGQFFSFVFTGAGELINTDRNSPTYGDTVLVSDVSQIQTDSKTKRVYDTLGFFQELYDAKVCNTGHGGEDAFGNSLCAMTYGSIYFPQKIANYPAKNYKMLPYPARDRSYVGKTATVIKPNEQDANGMLNGQAGGMLGGYGLAIGQPKNKAHRNAAWEERVAKAWEVIKLWTTNDEINRLFFTATESITARADLLSDEYYSQDGIMKDIIPYLDNYKMRPSVAGYEQFEANICRSEIQKLQEGSQNALTTLAAIRDDGNTQLRQAQGRG